MISLAQALRKRFDMPSGPLALLVFSLVSKLRTPVSSIVMLGILGYFLECSMFGSGVSLSSFVYTEEN